MEHEVLVPVPVERLRRALGEPARIARAVPGLQQDAGAEPVAGRLKVRVGGHSITYRGSLRVSARDDGSYAVEGEAAEARGTGTVKLTLTLRLRDADGGTAVTVDGTVSADGRITELPAGTVSSAAIRLLNRFVESLATTPDDDTETEVEPEEEAASVFETEVPPPSLVPEAGEEGSAGFAADGPPAEAAHARRTMIGRSAEEVDHAPPRGRYAPVPAPETVAGHSVLRWVAPAAALALASAIVLGRALRRRR
ncbi:SRPBCC domain-containing protein [Streptomyces shenzhenensis]|uniref:Carbon monoxide dehydrogenase subunit G n=1 Tax=Streptomyces shenzhenensis TaxID=943815 RepID=A0A3M0INA5_9ACTN|nr:SRPBCC domain-containing protein [Streptomyces shenzhenensis]RMB83566.1 carbon monoxide dehydrogenase subunit G [Streptomyces shenzhenensis]